MDIEHKEGKDGYECKLNKDYQVSGDTFYYVKTGMPRCFRWEQSV